jgi:hypothetical protein
MKIRTSLFKTTTFSELLEMLDWNFSSALFSKMASPVEAEESNSS